VTTTTCVGASWPQIDFLPTLQKQTKKEQGKLETITSQYQKIGKQHVLRWIFSGTYQFVDRSLQSVMIV